MQQLKNAAGSLSKARLARLTAVLEGYVERGEIPGVVTRIFRHGELAHQDRIGWFDYETRQTPLQDDSLFRIASMTKPIVAVAVLTLVEETRLRLDEPIEKWLPELANRQVLVNPEGTLDSETYASPRSITLRDLLTYRTGIGWMGLNNPYERAAVSLLAYPLTEIWTKQGGKLPFEQLDPDAWMKRVGEMPLRFAPGERWLYHVSSDILGVLVSRVSGMGLEDFLRQRIFEPLGMKDTSFSVPSEKRDRLPSAYTLSANTGKNVLIDTGQDTAYSTSPVFPSGGGGLVSTADDYLKFGRMLLNNGELDGQRVLSRKTIEVMTTDYLTPEQHTHTFQLPGYWQNRGFGFGVSVITGTAHPGQNLGSYSWGGAFGTAWFNDPGEDMVAVMMIQQGGNPTIREDFGTLVYQAIDD